MVLWIFAYGSLIWRPTFKFDERVVGFIKGYRRVFYQACIDHRGTVVKPGRTLTLEESEGGITWGVAYRVTAQGEQQMVEAYLNQRERTYNVRALLEVYTADCSHMPVISEALTYIATPDSSNLWYLGPAPLEAIAKQIAESHGPAGPNSEYLFRLEESLYRMGDACVDDDVVKLAKEVRKSLAANGSGHKRILRYGPIDTISEYRAFLKVSRSLRSRHLELPANEQSHPNSATFNSLLVRA